MIASAGATLSEAQHCFVDASRVGHLATAERDGVPHIVPVCYALAGSALYITVDEKPKRTDRPLKRLRNIADNPSVAVLVDRYEEDWTRLGWVLLRGRAEILLTGPEHDQAQAQLSSRYRQYATMDLAPLPVIALRIERVTSWGNLSPV